MKFSEFLQEGVINPHDKVESALKAEKIEYETVKNVKGKTFKFGKFILVSGNDGTISLYKDSLENKLDSIKVFLSNTIMQVVSKLLKDNGVKAA